MAVLGNVCLTGGLYEFTYLKDSLSHHMGKNVHADPDGRYAGAMKIRKQTEELLMSYTLPEKSKEFADAQNADSCGARI